ncbi:MAG TPA: hypothetical protein PKD85_10550, partial [Saprospiraceae bacterium]|nr:hypothetical protein [Saprospiraceae bacterium]
MYKVIVFISFLFLNVLSFSQSLKLEEIMKGDEFIGHQPTNHRWAVDGETALFSWNPSNLLVSETYYWKESMMVPEPLPKNLKFLEEIPSNDQKEFSEIFYIKSGGIYKFNKIDKTMSKVYVTSDRVSGLIRGYDPDILYFRNNDNIYSLNTKQGALLQLTNFKKGKKPSIASKKQDFLSNQQEELFLFVQEAKERKSYIDEKNKENLTVTLPKEWYSEWNYTFLSPSPDGKYVVFGLSEPIIPKPTRVEAFITEDGYTASQNARSKVSINNLYKTQLALYSVDKDSVITIDFS